MRQTPFRFRVVPPRRPKGIPGRMWFATAPGLALRFLSIYTSPVQTICIRNEVVAELNR